MTAIGRRNFLKGSIAGVGGSALSGLAPGNLAAAPPKSIPLKKKFGETVSVCPYCGVGCGLLVGSDGKKVTSVEGYADHPINRGALCSKAQSLVQLRTVDGRDNHRRLTKVLYRAANGIKWEEKSWDWALGEIARKIKKTRDANWTGKDKDGVTVNRTEALAQLGGAAHDNEECYLLSKMGRALGIVYLEHQARI
jgi:formate dehydrogenase major subunit